jgi:hypothetical protein
MILTLINDADKFLEVEASTLLKSLQTRLVSALKKFTIFFLLAVGSVFIPIAHFVLVPCFLVAAIINLIKEFKVDNFLLVKGSYDCLKCGKNLVMPFSLNKELRIECKNCFQQYKASFR